MESGDNADMAGDFEIDPTAHSTADAITYNEDASSLSNDSSRDETDFNKSQALARKCLADLGFRRVIKRMTLMQLRLSRDPRRSSLALPEHSAT